MTEYYNPDGSRWTPKFVGQRPPFQRGNHLGVGNRLSHGARSPQRVEPFAREIAAELQAECPWLRAPRFYEPLWRYARARARQELFDRWMDALPIAQAAAGAWPPLEQSRVLGVRALNLASAIGLVPLPDEGVQQLIDAALRDLENDRPQHPTIESENTREQD